MVERIQNQFVEYLLSTGLSERYSELTVVLILVIATLVIGVILDKVIRFILLNVFTNIVKKTETDWDDILVENRVFSALAHFIPVLFIFNVIPQILDHSETWVIYLERLGDIVLILAALVIIFRLMNAIRSLLKKVDSLKDKPLDSYFQLAKIIISIILVTLIISIIFQKSILHFFGAFGAMTAVVLLVFKDTILGFIASIQLAANDMIRVGDWVSMEKFGADGDVIEINLTTVKVRNWDKTISTVPTYSFISDSFKNWRGMQETGSRRIARSIYINQQSVKFVDEELISKFKNIHILKDYVKSKEKEIAEYNSSQSFDAGVVSNGRRMTNLGTFRVYLTKYIENHPKINKDLTIMARQLEPTQYGIPIQIYCFSSDIEWTNYEAIQSDIFDHVLAVVHQFELEIFQNPSGNDFKRLLN